jgi:hypothetical protein
MNWPDSGDEREGAKTMKKKVRHDEISRRRFIQGSIAGAAALGVAPGLLTPRPARGQPLEVSLRPDTDRLRVVGVHDPAMTRGTEPVTTWARQEALIADPVVEQNIDRMARALTGKESAGEAWRTIFTKPPDKAWNKVVVAIKTNNIGRQHSHSAVLRKVCSVLVDEMGVQPGSVFIYDGVHGKKMMGKTPFKDLPRGCRIANQWGGIDTPVKVPAPWKQGLGETACIRPLGLGEVDILVNLAVCKGHGKKFGGFTMTMKNHFGSFDPKWGHRDHATDYLLSINKTSQVLGEVSQASGSLERPRQQLCIVDALWASQKGPHAGSSSQPNRLFMGTLSPVVDYQVATQFRRDIMHWPIDEEVTGRFLSDFGVSRKDLPDGGRILDAMKV